jgi:DNA polymerase III epsilon subunit-like protein
MILMDCETTGLVQPLATPLSQQPHIIEFAAIRLDDSTLEEIEGKHIHFLCKPPIPLPEIITKITGLTDRDLEGKPPFVKHYRDLCEFFFGEHTVVAHNLSFDRSLLQFELMRLDRLTQFPWPYNHQCTVERTLAIKGHRLKQEELYLMATGHPAEQTHRALDDVRQLAEVVRWLRQKDLM